MCSYSRSGVLRRSAKQTGKRKRKQKQGEELPTTSPAASGLGGGLQQPSQLASDNAARSTQERLQGLVGGDLDSLRQLASLLEEYAAAWQAPSAFGQLAQDAASDFYLFDMSQCRIWLDGRFHIIRLLKGAEGRRHVDPESISRAKSQIRIVSFSKHSPTEKSVR